VTVALPALKFAVASTACVTVSTNSTLPVGVPSPGGKAITSTVHTVPKFVSVVTVAARLTVTLTTTDCAAGQLEVSRPTGGDLVQAYSERDHNVRGTLRERPRPEDRRSVEEGDRASGRVLTFPDNCAKRTTCWPKTAVDALTVSFKVSVGIVDPLTTCV